MKCSNLNKMASMFPPDSGSSSTGSTCREPLRLWGRPLDNDLIKIGEETKRPVGDSAAFLSAGYLRSLTTPISTLE